MGEVLENWIWLFVGGGLIYAGYKAGWEARGARQKKDEAAEELGWFELNLIFSEHDEAAIAALDKEFNCDALGRLRKMSPEAVSRFRSGRGALFDELSDRLVLQERRSKRTKQRIAADPNIDPDVKRMFLGEEQAA